MGRAPTAKLGKGEKTSPLPKLSWGRGRGAAASRNTIHTINTTVKRDFYIWDFATNPDSGFLHSGLFCSGKVRGAKELLFLNRADVISVSDDQPMFTLYLGILREKYTNIARSTNMHQLLSIVTNTLAYFAREKRFIIRTFDHYTI